MAAALAEESPRWEALIDIEKGIEQQAQEGWSKAKSSWAFDDLAQIVEEALREAVSDVKQSFEEVRDDEWTDAKVNSFLSNFTLLDFLNGPIEA